MCQASQGGYGIDYASQSAQPGYLGNYLNQNTQPGYSHMGAGNDYISQVFWFDDNNIIWCFGLT